MFITPKDDDVLFGRGYAISAHPGNQHLRTKVRTQKPIFLKSKRMDKRDVAYGIVQQVQKSGGRFLIEDATDLNNYAACSIFEKSWVVVDTEKAVDKVMHRLREKDKKPSQVSSSSSSSSPPSPPSSSSSSSSRAKTNNNTNKASKADNNAAKSKTTHVPILHHSSADINSNGSSQSLFADLIHVPVQSRSSTTTTNTGTGSSGHLINIHNNSSGPSITTSMHQTQSAQHDDVHVPSSGNGNSGLGSGGEIIQKINTHHHPVVDQLQTTLQRLSQQTLNMTMQQNQQRQNQQQHQNQQHQQHQHQQNQHTSNMGGSGASLASTQGGNHPTLTMTMQQQQQHQNQQQHQHPTNNLLLDNMGGPGMGPGMGPGSGGNHLTAAASLSTSNTHLSIMRNIMPQNNNNNNNNLFNVVGGGGGGQQHQQQSSNQILIQQEENVIMRRGATTTTTTSCHRQNNAPTTSSNNNVPSSLLMIHRLSSQAQQQGFGSSSNTNNNGNNHKTSSSAAYYENGSNNNNNNNNSNNNNSNAQSLQNAIDSTTNALLYHGSSSSSTTHPTQAYHHQQSASSSSSPLLGNNNNNSPSLQNAFDQGYHQSAPSSILLGNNNNSPGLLLPIPSAHHDNNTIAQNAQLLFDNNNNNAHPFNNNNNNNNNNNHSNNDQQIIGTSMISNNLKSGASPMLSCHSASPGIKSIQSHASIGSSSSQMSFQSQYNAFSVEKKSSSSHHRMSVKSTSGGSAGSSSSSSSSPMRYNNSTAPLGMNMKSSTQSISPLLPEATDAINNKHGGSFGGGGRGGLSLSKTRNKYSFYFLEENAISMAERSLFPMTVVEFLKLGLGSRHNNNIRSTSEEAESESDADADDNGNGNGNGENNNIARLALVVTRVFVGHLLSGFLNPGTSSSSIRLDNFAISLERVSNEKNDASSKLGSSIATTCRKTLFRMEISASFPKSSSVGIGLGGHAQIYTETGCSSIAIMQLLGKLLYSVFMQGEPFPPDLLTPSEAKAKAKANSTSLFESDNEEDAIGRRSFRRLRVTERSVFSSLIGSKSLPVSVCRLLSDMLDTGPAGKADMPLDSFEDVVQDLRQMIFEPGTFFHDSSFPHSREEPSQSLLCFGQQQCHGRKEELATLNNITRKMEQCSHHEQKLACPHSGIEAVFVSGIAGSGKSHFVNAIAEKLTSGWIIIKAKFERGREHASRRILSSMFDELIANIANMRKSEREHDVSYSIRVSEAMTNAIGADGLSSLVDFLPSLPMLFDGISNIDAKVEKMPIEDNNGQWRMIYSLSKVLEVVLESDRFIMICCDDLQWADKSTLLLLSEVLVNIGSLKHISRRCLFLGLFREEEIDSNPNHPFCIQYNYICMMTDNINVTKIQLSSLSKNDIADMLIAELHLPRRIVFDLADVVQKKTSGHAVFVVQLLNSLIRDSIVTYDSQKRRFSWDQDTISFIQIGDGVAGLIASNLKSLPEDSQGVLRILACLGIQTSVSILQMLMTDVSILHMTGTSTIESLDDGTDDEHVKRMVSSLDLFIEQGILDKAGPIVMFTHDLIQQQMYESMPLDERQNLHLRIGKYLGALASVDSTPAHDIAYLQGSYLASSLIAIACDQIDSVGPDFISDDGEKEMFAKWNLSAGLKSSRESNSRAAQYYFLEGIKFLGQGCWQNQLPLCLALHEGAVAASFSLGEPGNVALYASMMTSNTSFDDSLDIQPIVLRSLAQVGRHEEAIQKGIEILRQLHFDLPSAPTLESVMNAMASTEAMASQYSVHQLMELCEKVVDDSVHQVVKIMDAFYTSCYASASLFLPIISCEMIKYSLQCGICQESTIAYATYGMLLIFNKGDYAGGQHWANNIRAIVKKRQSMNKSNMASSFEIRPKLLVYLATDIWFTPARVISQKLLGYHQTAMQMGQIDVAMIAFQTAWRFRLLGGENLSLIYKSSEDRLRLISKHSEYAAKCALLDSILLMELTGKSGNYFSAFDGRRLGSINNMNDLQDVAKSSKDLQLLQSSHVFNVLVEYWRGNYEAAEYSSGIASMMLPASKMPTIYLIYHTFFRGLVLFALYRSSGDDQRLKDGKKAVDEMERWTKNSKDVFENKWLLLKAEYHASIDDFDQALQMYEGSIKAALDNGSIHELALAHNLLGKYHLERGFGTTANESLKKAYLYYTQWGATAVATNMHKKYNLGMDSAACQELHVQNQKHQRQWD